MKKASQVVVKPRHPRESPEKMIRRFLKKVKKERIVEDYLDRRFHVKPSTKKRREKLKKLKNARKAEAERVNKSKIRENNRR